MSLSREEEERLERLSQGLGWTESFTSTFRRSLERKSPSERHQELATMEKGLPGGSAGASAEEQGPIAVGQPFRMPEFRLRRPIADILTRPSFVHGGLSREEEARFRRFAEKVSEDQARVVRDLLEKSDPSMRQNMLDMLEGETHLSDPNSLFGPVNRVGNRGHADQSPLLFGRQPWDQDLNLDRFNKPTRLTCDRCNCTLTGKYYKMSGYDFCRRCVWIVKIRVRMLNAQPNRQAQRLLRSAFQDLRQATRLEPGNPQVENNLKNIRSLGGRARGNLFGLLFWSPLWVLALGLDIWRRQPWYILVVYLFCAVNILSLGGRYWYWWLAIVIAFPPMMTLLKRAVKG